MATLSTQVLSNVQCLCSLDSHFLKVSARDAMDSQGLYSLDVYLASARKKPLVTILFETSST